MSYDLKDLKVLVVDDKPYMCTLVRAILAGFEIGKVEVAGDGSQGYDKFRLSNPNIVITDWNMQPANGRILVWYIRNCEDSPNRIVPIIVMTGHTEPECITQIRDAGATEILAKPFSGNLLIERINSALSKPRSFVRSANFSGPDRRRRKLAEYVGIDRRCEGQTQIVASQLIYEELAAKEINDLDDAFSAMKQSDEFDIPLLLDHLQWLEGHGHRHNYPLITDFAGSLSHFLGNCDALDKTGPEIVDAHLTALAFIASNRMSGQDNETGREMHKCLRELVGMSLVKV